jgi:protein tyrosine/serine phosphatase
MFSSPAARRIGCRLTGARLPAMRSMGSVPRTASRRPRTSVSEKPLPQFPSMLYAPPMLFRPRADIDRYHARMARLARWEKPLTTPRDRLAAWASMILADHGIFRLFYLNRHAVSAKLLRAAQPWPHQIRAFARAGGRTLVYLRGGREHGSWPLELAAATQEGITIRDFVVRSREAPEKEMLLSAPAFFADLQYPAMIHCKSGADRAGFVAALYLVVHEGVPVREARDQLHWRFGHFRFAKTGILDAFFDWYLEDGAPKGVTFLDWVRDQYDPALLKARFKPGFWSSLAADRILRRE